MKSSYKHFASLGIGTEPTYNLLYLNVYPEKSGRGRKKKELDYSYISNIAIYNRELSDLTYLFKKGSQQKIINFLYEKNYNDETGCMEFSGINPYLLIDGKTPKRSCLDTLLIVTQAENEEHLIFWKATKKGENLREIQKVSKSVDWRIDVANRKILFVSRQPNEVFVKSIHW